MVKLIIVDDHRHVREAWSLVLSRVGNIEIIAQCSNGREAIDAAISKEPDVILMDIHMEPVNGIEATRVIKRTCPSIKIIAVSIQADRSYVNEMLKSGADGYVTKNSTSAEMLKAINSVLSGQTYLCGEIAHFTAS